jgi:hypothetical protein
MHQSNLHHVSGKRGAEESRHRDGEPSKEWRDYQGAPTGTDIECGSWRQKAALRMLNDNLGPEDACTRVPSQESTIIVVRNTPRFNDATTVDLKVKAPPYRRF